MATTYFITGTMYTVHYPDGMDVDLEDIYSNVWDGELPDGVEVEEGEVTHYWEGETL